MRYLGCVKPLILAVIVWAAALVAADLATVEPKDLAAELASGVKPAIFHVGPSVLYRSRHIPGAIDVNMASKAENLDALRTAAFKLPRDRDVFLYCGCCPWDRCPNIKPAVALLHQMGFTRVKA